MAALSLYGGRCIKSWKLVEDPNFQKCSAFSFQQYDFRFPFLRCRIFFASDVEGAAVCVLLREFEAQ